MAAMAATVSWWVSYPGSWVPVWRISRRSGESRKRRKASRRRGWAAMLRSASAFGVSVPDRSKRLPAMTRSPGPSQASRARASSVLTVVEEAVAVPESRRSLTTMTRRPMGTSTTTGAAGSVRATDGGPPSPVSPPLAASADSGADVLTTPQS